MNLEISETITVTPPHIIRSPNSSAALVNINELAHLWIDTIDGFRSRSMVFPFDIQIILKRFYSLGSMRLVEKNPHSWGKYIRYKGANITINPAEISEQAIRLISTYSPLEVFSPSTIEANFTFFHEWRHLVVKVAESYHRSTSFSANEAEEKDCDQFANQKVIDILRQQRPPIIRGKELEQFTVQPVQ